MSNYFSKIIYYVYKNHFFLCKCHISCYNIIRRCGHMKYGRGYVYDLYYHIVWCVKYRHKILVNEVKDDFIDIITNICKNNNYELIEINTDMDHVHILLGLSPQDSIPVVMKTLKGVSARLLNQKHKALISKVLYDGHIWSPSYYIATTSDNIMDNIKEYIKNQGNEDLRKG